MFVSPENDLSLLRAGENFFVPYLLFSVLAREHFTPIIVDIMNMK